MLSMQEFEDVERYAQIAHTTLMHIEAMALRSKDIALLDEIARLANEAQRHAPIRRTRDHQNTREAGNMKDWDLKHRNIAME